MIFCQIIKAMKTIRATNKINYLVQNKFQVIYTVYIFEELSCQTKQELKPWKMLPNYSLVKGFILKT